MQDAKRRLERLLARLVALENDNDAGVHDRGVYSVELLRISYQSKMIAVISPLACSRLSKWNRERSSTVRRIVARKTVLVCDNCGSEVEEGKGAVMRVTFQRRSSRRKGGGSLRLVCRRDAGDRSGAHGRKPKAIAS